MLKDIVCFMVIFACGNSLYADDLLLKPSDSIKKEVNGKVTIQLQNCSLEKVARILTKCFLTPICAEDYLVLMTGSSQNTLPSSIATGGPIRREDRPLFTGTYTALTLEEMLSNIINNVPYEWVKNGTCYVIFPSIGSVLTDKVTVDIQSCSLSDAIENVVFSRSIEDRIKVPITPFNFSHGLPHLQPQDLVISQLHFVDTPLIDALCRTVEAISTEGAFLARWDLCGSWGGGGKTISISLYETEPDSLLLRK